MRQPHDPACAAVRVLAPVSGFYHNYPHALAPEAGILYLRDWMVVDYLPGEVKTYLPDTNELAGLLYYLHQQPRFGWRITLLPLLELYWQQSDPARRTVGWLRRLKRLLQSAANPGLYVLSSIAYGCPRRQHLVHSASGLKLIDWEYAGDGDIALELAAVWVENTDHAPAIGHMTMPLARRFIRAAIMASGQAMVSLAADAQSRAGLSTAGEQTGDQQFISAGR